MVAVTKVFTIYFKRTTIWIDTKQFVCVLSC